MRIRTAEHIASSVASQSFHLSDQWSA